jgi:AraC-like DNA-binding protein
MRRAMRGDSPQPATRRCVAAAFGCIAGIEDVTAEGNVLVDWQLTEILMRGMAIGALCATAVAFARLGPSLSIRIAGLFFCASVVGFVLTSSPAWREASGPLMAPAQLLSMGGGGYFWLFVVVLFEDRKITWANLAPAGLLTAIGIAGVSAVDPLRANIWIVHNLIEMTLAAHALYVIYSSWRGDLVEARRRLRGPFLAAVTLLTIVLSGFEIGESFGVYENWYSVAGAVTLAAFCLAGCFVFLEPRPALFGAALAAKGSPPEPDEPTLDPADRATLDRLAEAMGQGEAWRKEGLTIAALAEQVGTPEHRLRRLINDHLGHRNFAAYVNARRIEAAKQILCDPAQARTTVAAVAFDLGFGSLGPFNRAFKEETGLTPTEWRRQAFDNGSPNPENAG